jgi:lysophospholipase L1-like esterase
MRRSIPLLLSLVVLVAAGSATVAPVEPVVVRVADAHGVPATSCPTVRARPPAPPVASPPSSPAPPDDPGLAALPKVDLGGGASGVPVDPASLPPQPLEGSPEALARVAGVMERIGRGERVRVSVFGASHTQGDFWTGHLRRLLQRRAGDAGHGFVMPAAIVPGYRAQDVNLCRSDGWRADYVGRPGGHGDAFYGLMGASVSSADPTQFGWIETTHDNPEGRRVASYDLFTLGQPAGGGLVVRIDDAAPITVSTRADAPSLLRHRFEVADGEHRLELRPAGDGEVRVFGLSAERPGPGVIVDAMGVRGRSIRSWLYWDRAMADQGLATLDPDLVVLAYGTNEAADVDYTMDAYRADLRRALGMLRAAAPDVACVLVGPTDTARRLRDGSYAAWPRTAEVAQVQREEAPAFGCASWDWQQATGGPGSIVAWRLQREPLAAEDLIHLTPKGYVLSAERFLDALDGAGKPRG